MLRDFPGDWFRETSEPLGCFVGGTILQHGKRRMLFVCNGCIALFDIDSERWSYIKYLGIPRATTFISAHWNSAGKELCIVFLISRIERYRRRFHSITVVRSLIEIHFLETERWSVTRVVEFDPMMPAATTGGSDALPAHYAICGDRMHAVATGGSHWAIDLGLHAETPRTKFATGPPLPISRDEHCLDAIVPLPFYNLVVAFCHSCTNNCETRTYAFDGEKWTQWGWVPDTVDVRAAFVAESSDRYLVIMGGLLDYGLKHAGRVIATKLYVLDVSKHHFYRSALTLPAAQRVAGVLLFDAGRNMTTVEGFARTHCAHSVPLVIVTVINMYFRNEQIHLVLERTEPTVGMSSRDCHGTYNLDEILRRHPVL